MPRGGPRAGLPGKAYPQRTDLPGKALPVQTATGQPYGQAKLQEQAQNVVPMAPPPAPSGPAVPPGPLPGEAGAFDRPTERPGEPVTAGLPIGAGPGPEVLPRQVSTIADSLSQLSQAIPGFDIAFLADRARELGV